MFRNDKEKDVLEQQDPINDVFTYPFVESFLEYQWYSEGFVSIELPGNFLFTINSTEKDNVKNKKVKTDEFHWYRCQINYNFFQCELFHANFCFH